MRPPPSSVATFPGIGEQPPTGPLCIFEWQGPCLRSRPPGIQAAPPSPKRWCSPARSEVHPVDASLEECAAPGLGRIVRTPRVYISLSIVRWPLYSGGFETFFLRKELASARLKKGLVPPPVRDLASGVKCSRAKLATTDTFELKGEFVIFGMRSLAVKVSGTKQEGMSRPEDSQTGKERILFRI